MKKSMVIILVIVVAVAAGGAYVLAKNSKKTDANTPAQTTNTPSTTPAPTSSQSSSQSTPAAQNTITYSSSGFSPATLTVKSGTTVMIKNDSSSLLQFDSNPHPAHTDDTELNVGSISPGQSKTVTVTKTGSHDYHNHLNPSDTGTLVVQ